MKRIIIISVLFAFGMVSFARKFVTEGNSNTDFGEYKIEIADTPLILKGNNLKTLVVSYENSKMEVYVVFEKHRRGMTYFVLSDALSIKYTCRGGIFGVSLLGKELDADGYFTSESVLNKRQYFYQRIISTGGSCDLEYSKLIACFFPMLINNTENIITAN